MTPEGFIYVPDSQLSTFNSRTADIDGLRIDWSIPKKEIPTVVDRKRGRARGAKNSERVELSGEKLRALRKLHGLTQGQLAEQARVSTPYISSIERGRLKFGAEVNMARDISQALGIPLEALTKGKRASRTRLAKLRAT